MTFAIHQRDAELRGIEIGKQAGMMIGEKRGAQKAKAEAVKKMLDRGMPIKITKAISPTCPSTIEQLQAEQMATSADDRIH